MIDKICIECESVFQVRNYRANSAFYCSRECACSSTTRRQKCSDALKGRCVNPQTTFKKGHRQSLEARVKMSLAKRGKSPVNKKPDAFLVCFYCGQIKKIKVVLLNRAVCCSRNCANKYKDQGRTDMQKKLRTSVSYKEWRTAIFERDNFTCVICNMQGGRLNADHIKRFADYPELRLDINNGRTLCEACHRKTNTYGNRPKNSETSKWRQVAAA